MKLESEVLDGGIKRLALEGRLDTAGVQEIDLRFTALASTQKANVVIDLAGVTLLASIGIRLLVMAARGQKGRGGRLVLVSAQPAVKTALVTAGMNQFIPMFDDVASARAAFAAA